jgi:hypothetical protein
VATRSRLQGATKQKSGRCSAKPSLAVSTKLGRRSYAMMYHDDPYVAHDYKKYALRLPLESYGLILPLATFSWPFLALC